MFLLAGSSAIANYRSEGSSARSWNGEDCCLLNVCATRKPFVKNSCCRMGSWWCNMPPIPVRPASAWFFQFFDPHNCHGPQAMVDALVRVLAVK